LLYCFVFLVVDVVDLSTGACSTPPVPLTI
jgi:hypothetical protein